MSELANLIDADYLHSAAYNRAHSPFLRLPAEIRESGHAVAGHARRPPIRAVLPIADEGPRVVRR